ncbi:hypothetical protein BDY19DRAFT_237718 [Irpex rosettiformis]|uniref:Uncharacterized protein n=1 Tax=Irpex rosettiformis TaxID=378272 RepID=A0ACB8U0H8_9APHY|nr:hypothetical protein BDY19DRAFT_237718 [Irpex rosettiformis]
MSSNNNSTAVSADGATVVASAPFNLPTADVTFRTHDGVEYRLHKAILSIASPFFNDMFSLTQPHGTDAANPEVIPITELSRTFDTLLRHCYPVDRPVFSTLASLIPVLEAAIKYQILSTVTVLRQTMVRFLEADTLDVYAAACRLNFENEAKLAAVEWKKKASWDDTSSDFSRTSASVSFKGKIFGISAGAFFNLLRFMRADADQDMRFTTNTVDSSPSTEIAADLPFMPDDSLSCDTVLISKDSVKIYAHSLLVRLAGGECLFRDRVPDTVVTGDPDDPLPCTSLSNFRVDLDSRTLRTLVMLFYPHPEIQGIPFHAIQDTIKAAVRFKVSKVINILRQYLQRRIDTNPIAVYRIAFSRGWRNEAKKALQGLLQSGVPKLTYCSDLDGAFSFEYLKFLQLEHNYQLDALNVVTRYNDKCVHNWRRIDGDLSLLRTAPYLPMIEGRAYLCYKSCGSGLYGSSRNSRCVCNVELLSETLGRCESLQARLRTAAEEIVTKHLARFMK